MIVDYKTDAIPPAAIGVRATYYRPQLDAYVRAHRDATGEPVSARLLFLTPGAAATEVWLTDDGTGLE